MHISIAERIKEIRLELGYNSQEEFAKALGLSKQNIQTYESGSEPKSKFYINLFLIHRVNPLYIMGVTDKKYGHPEKSEAKRNIILNKDELKEMVSDQVSELLRRNKQSKKKHIIPLNKYGGISLN